MSNSILDDVKKTLNLDPSYTAFDGTIILHINTVFSILNGLGVGPTAGFSIGNNTVLWDAYGAVDADRNMNLVKTYMGLRVKMMFDPPTTSYAIDATLKLIEELECRISYKREETGWTDPNPPAPIPPPTWCEMF